MIVIAGHANSDLVTQPPTANSKGRGHRLPPLLFVAVFLFHEAGFLGLDHRPARHAQVGHVAAHEMLHDFDPLLQFRTSDQVTEHSETRTGLLRRTRRSASLRSHPANNMTETATFQALG